MHNLWAVVLSSSATLRCYVSISNLISIEDGANIRTNFNISNIFTIVQLYGFLLDIEFSSVTNNTFDDLFDSFSITG